MNRQLGGALACLWIFIAYRLAKYAKSNDGWIIGDWLINYAHGFTRRGIQGAPLLALANCVGLSPVWSAWALVLLLFTIFLWLFYRLAQNRVYPTWYLFALLSPAALLYPFWQKGAIGRKEEVYFVILAAFALRMRGRATGAIRFPELLGWGVLGFAATLSHELFAFFLPWFWIVTSAAGGLRPVRLTAPAVLTLGSLTALALAVTVGREIPGPETCAQLLAMGTGREICDGILAYPIQDSRSALASIAVIVVEQQYLAVYGAALSLASVPFWIHAWQHGLQARSLLLGLGALLASAPLFAVSTDWGRWIHVHALSALIAATLFLPDNPDQEPRPAGSLRKLALTSSLALYACGWSFSHHGGQLGIGILQRLGL